jgi:hypothetical protein
MENLMSTCEIINADHLLSALNTPALAHAPVNLTFSRDGRWHIMKLRLSSVTEDGMTLSGLAEDVKIYQPVGICVVSGHYKLLFESQINDVQGDTVCIDFPRSAERMPRRAYIRQPVPSAHVVKVLFWHRGYIDGSDRQPEEHYWQGRLVNLSAGGAQFAIDNDQKQFFSSGQLLGVQFTPLSYQKPFLLDSIVKYLKDNPENGHFKIGVEFLGLESPEGRQALHRIMEVLTEYERMAHPRDTAVS